MNTTEIKDVFKRRGIQVTIKLVIISILVLILLIPKVMILDLVRERKDYSESVIDEQTRTWGGEQILSGPLLKIPYYTKFIEKVVVKEKLEEKTTEIKNFLYLFPKDLNYIGEIKKDSKNRSLYTVEVYEADLNMKGHFELPTEVFSTIDNLIRIDYENVVLIYGIADLKGMVAIPNVIFDEKEVIFEPETKDFSFYFNSLSTGRYVDLSSKEKSGVSALLSLDSSKKVFPFDAHFTLRGSIGLGFVPVAKQTYVNLKSNFLHPSFQGAFSNINTVSSDGFNAEWTISEFNRSLPNYWLNHSEIDLKGNEFGVNLISPVNHYTKSERTTKYMFLVIVLTFLAFFIIEIVNQLRIHVFQYALVGIALAVFFTLLLALSEYIGYDYSYLISALATVVLIILYSFSIFHNRKSSILLLGLLLIIFGFIYTIIQMEEYSLLVGTIGLFITVAMTMYTTRKIKWYESN